MVIYGWCYGRPYVNEAEITPEQYKMFFGRYEFGISFKMANSILKRNSEGDYDEIVPCDELNTDAIYQIKDQAVYAEYDEDLEGTIEHEGQTLDWKWTPKVEMDEGEEISFFDLSESTKEHILKCMLDDECHRVEIFEYVD